MLLSCNIPVNYVCCIIDTVFTWLNAAAFVTLVQKINAVTIQI